MGYVFMSVIMFRHLYVCLYIHISVSTFLHPSLHLYVYWLSTAYHKDTVSFLQCHLLKCHLTLTDLVPWFTIIVVTFITGVTLGYSVMPNDVFFIITSRAAPGVGQHQGGNSTPSWGYLSLFEGFYLYLDGNILDVFLVVCSHYVSCLCDHYYSTCDCCVLQNITHHYNTDTCSYL